MVVIVTEVSPSIAPLDAKVLAPFASSTLVATYFIRTMLPSEILELTTPSPK